MTKKALLVPGVVLTIALTACGNPAATGDDNAAKLDPHAKKVFDKYNALSGQARTDALVKEAQDEGEVSIYTSNTDMDTIVDAFSDKYDIDVNTYRGNSESVLQRVLGESKANFTGVDLVETNSGELNVMASKDIFYPYKSEYRDAVRQEGQKDGWTADRFNVFTVAWNTDKVKESDLPESIEGFADPKWKGRISMEVGDTDWFATMWQYFLDQGKTEDEVKAMFTKLASNAKIVKGHTVQAELLSAGEFDAGLSLYTHSVQEATEDGRPITWQPSSRPPLQPLVIRPNGAGLVATAEHPAAALLFMDFLLTDGQKAIADEYRIGSVPTADDPLKGLETIDVDEDEMLNNAKHWDDLYAQITQGGEATE